MSVPTLDKCPGYNLYIGGFIALRRPQALKNANITHIVSVLDWKFDDDTPLTRGYQHLHIPVDDVEDENLLQWFPRSNPFVREGLDYWKTHPSNSSEDVPAGEQPGARGSGVLIHCAMGKSRSATILLAYLLWSSRHQVGYHTSPQQSPENPDMVSLPTKPLTVIKALELLRQGRPIAEPNEGFMDQLYMYEDMGCPTTEVEMKKHKIYRRWMNKRSVEESLRVNMPPEMAAIKFEDESDDDDDDNNNTTVTTASSSSLIAPALVIPASAVSNSKEIRSQGEIKGKGVTTVAPGIKAPDGTSIPSTSPTTSSTPTPQLELKCRKCRHVLATTPFIQAHSPPPHTDPSFHKNTPTGTPSAKCAHIFLHPLSWMRPVLAEGQMEGRLTCPKCSTNIGKFAWSGLRCSCGGWVTPGFGVTRGRVDEVVPRHMGGGAARAGAGDDGVRLPPGMRRGGGNL